MSASGPVADAQVTGGARLADLESIRALAITYCRVRPTMHVVFNHLVHFNENTDLADGVVYGAGYQFAHALRPPRTRVVLGRYVDVYQR